MSSCDGKDLLYLYISKQVHQIQQTGREKTDNREGKTTTQLETKICLSYGLCCPGIWLTLE